ncbi:MAG: hypothetical protein MAG451_01093 [Anaerolineales bacterium]|nr:hypothetical protein [Anaerolineales bacterium]
MLDFIARMALSPLAPLSQPFDKLRTSRWERGELGSSPLELGEGVSATQTLGVGADSRLI